MAARQALFHLSRPVVRRAWRAGWSSRTSLRGFTGSAARWQGMQAASVSDGVAPHNANSPPTGVAFHDVSAEAVRPAFSKRITIELDGQPRVFDSVFLRDSCTCTRCVDPHSTNKNFATPEIPATIEGRCQIAPEFEDSGEMAVIEWKDDIKDWPVGHTTVLPLDFLRKSLQQEQEIQAKKYIPAAYKYWENTAMTREIQYLPYDSYMRNDKTLYKVLKALQTHGLVFLKGVPDPIPTDSRKGVSSIVERIGNIRNTFYGSTWDVRSVPEAKNVAYTHVFLGLHMDLCYLDLTPHLQFLHSMRARAPGGESMFSDSFYAAEQMRRENPELFKSLCEFPVTFHYFNDGQAYRQIRNTIELHDQSQPLTSPIKLINWSPPFQGPFSNDIGTADHGAKLREFLAATQRFDELINKPENMFEYRMEEGDCVIFDNRRVLHARRAFEADKGERWLKGAYIDRDVYASKLRVLEDIYATPA